MKKNKAFLLFEVTLTIAILSIGLVTVIRAISMCMKVAKASFNHNKAVNLAYEKMFDLELESQTDGLEEVRGEGIFPTNDNFSWKYEVEQSPYDNLGMLTLDIYWSENKKEGSYRVATYVKTEQ
jgi:competence protein ComGC